METAQAYDACDHRSLLFAEPVPAIGALETAVPGIVALQPMPVVIAPAMAVLVMVASARGVLVMSDLEKDVV